MDAAKDPSSPEQAENPGSVFPTEGEHVGQDEREEALDAMPAGNATGADMVDTDDVDSDAHDG